MQLLDVLNFDLEVHLFIDLKLVLVLGHELDRNFIANVLKLVSTNWMVQLKVLKASLAQVDAHAIFDLFNMVLPQVLRVRRLLESIEITIVLESEVLEVLIHGLLESVHRILSNVLQDVAPVSIVVRITVCIVRVTELLHVATSTVDRLHVIDESLEVLLAVAIDFGSHLEHFTEHLHLERLVHLFVLACLEHLGEVVILFLVSHYFLVLLGELSAVLLLEADAHHILIRTGAKCAQLLKRQILAQADWVRIFFTVLALHHSTRNLFECFDEARVLNTSDLVAILSGKVKHTDWVEDSKVEFVDLVDRNLSQVGFTDLKFLIIRLRILHLPLKFLKVVIFESTVVQGGIFL